jgi:hypothetical protein
MLDLFEHNINFEETNLINNNMKNNHFNNLSDTLILKYSSVKNKILNKK